MKRTWAFAFWYKGTFEIDDDASPADVDGHISRMLADDFIYKRVRTDNLKVVGYGVEVGPGADYGAPQMPTTKEQAGFKESQ